MKRLAVGLSTALLLSAQTPNPALTGDPILAAMRAEVDRAKQLSLPNQPTPYYVEVAVDDSQQFATTASLGATLDVNKDASRIPRVQVRVGTPAFDNNNYMYADQLGSERGRLADEGTVPLMRRQLWILLDRAYKGALEGLARKRSALRNITQQETLGDFTAAAATEFIEPVANARVDEKAWEKRIKDVSAVFSKYPKVLTSQVDFQLSAGTAYMANSEGTALRVRDDLAYVNIRAAGQAGDGMPVRDFVSFPRTDPGQLPGEADLRAASERAADNVTKLTAAPVGEDYTGPVLFEGEASAQLFAQLLGSQLEVPRPPVVDPGRSANISRSELEGRRGSRILPEWMDVTDDPTQETYQGKPLFGHFKVDLEGQKPQALKVIDGGKLSGYLLTRTPIRGYAQTNGRARIPGNFGAKAAVFSNLFIRAKETTPVAELKKKLLGIVDQRGLRYGILVRKLDYPASAPVDELRRLAEASAQRGGRIVTLPILIYKVYPDGREELVRGLRFRGASSRSLRDIIAAGNDENLFDVMQNGTILAQVGAGNFVTGATVIAPSVLFEDFEFERRTDDWPTLPVVPPPVLTGQNQ
jgi:TldD protein